MLLKEGANIEDHNENGHTPLMEAASAGHVEVARVLLEYGAGINTHSNEFKESALTLACYKGEPADDWTFSKVKPELGRFFSRLHLFLTAHSIYYSKMSKPRNAASCESILPGFCLSINHSISVHFCPPQPWEKISDDSDCRAKNDETITVATAQASRGY